MSEACQPGKGFPLDQAVCQAMGIQGWPSYYAIAPRSFGTDCGWFYDESRHVVAEVIADVERRSGTGDWRRGSQIREFTHYPPVSSQPAYSNAVLEKVAEWPFSKRRAFGSALSEQCRGSLGELMEWPAALIHFREQMPEFICRAALEVAGGGR